MEKAVFGIIYFKVMAFSGQISWQQKQVMQVSASTWGRSPIDNVRYLFMGSAYRQVFDQQMIGSTFGLISLSITAILNPDERF